MSEEKVLCPQCQTDGWSDNANYVEQMQWRDAATGKLLAASDFFPPATFEGLWRYDLRRTKQW
jgi:hypothetical protein